MLYVPEEIRDFENLGPEKVDRTTRLAVPICEADIRSHLAWHTRARIRALRDEDWGKFPHDFPDPKTLIGDTRRLLGDAAGFEFYCDFCLALDYDPIISETADEYEIAEAQWFERRESEWHASTKIERLWIDVFEEHVWKDDGWDCGPPLRDAIERLRDIAASNRLNILAAISNEPDSEPMLRETSPPTDLLKSSSDFIKDFEPPDYLIDGIIQRRFCYSITGQTGGGKTAVTLRICAHVAQGLALGNLWVAKGTVLYFAGENPTDVQMRWLGLCSAMGLDPEKLDVHFVTGTVPLSEVAERITLEVHRKRLALALVVVDTSAAYFETDDENSNTQAGAHARRLRSLTTLPGGPAVLINCHPTKRAGDDDLTPRGGGAFLNEVDGNIAARRQDRLVALAAQGKFRGPEFAPFSFELDTANHPLLRDTRGRNIPTVIARPIGDAGRAQIEAADRRDTDAVLRAIGAAPGNVSDIARGLAWILRNGAPNHAKARRAAIALGKDKLVEERRGIWRLTSKGQIELNGMDQAEQK